MICRFVGFVSLFESLTSCHNTGPGVILKSYCSGITQVFEKKMVGDCFVSAKFGPLVIFFMRWFGYNKITHGEMHEYQ